jgi:hypothetical protein
MFTLEQKIFIAQCYFPNGKRQRKKDGEWSYSTSRVFEEFQQSLFAVNTIGLIIPTKYEKKNCYCKNFCFPVKELIESS